MAGETAWKVYYELYVDRASSRLLQAHASKLVRLSESVEAWHSSQYGSVLAFCDETTLRLVRDYWRRFPGVREANAKGTYAKELQRSKGRFAENFPGGKARIVTSLRSASPVGIRCLDQAPDSFDRYWQHGCLTGSQADDPNPMFSTALSAHVQLDAYADPLLGFHLASGLVKLCPDSAYRVKAQGAGRVSSLARAAMCQFGAWISGFRAVCKRGLKLRFVVSDALAFCHTLQRNGQDGALSANLYRRLMDVSILALDAGQYGAKGGAPRTFDAIDSNNLTDYLGSLNILVATKPLLKPAASSTIYLETLHSMFRPDRADLDVLLCGHAPTMSLLLGLTLVEHCTNATSKCWVDERVLAESSRRGGHLLCRWTWKLTDYLHGQQGKASLPRIEPRALARTFFAIYLRMFEQDDPRTVIAMMMPRGDGTAHPKFLPSPHYVRGSLVRLIKHARSSIQTDWSIVCETLLELIGGDYGLPSSGRCMDELAIQLHMHGLLAPEWLSCASGRSGQAGFLSWKQIPPAIVITLVVPRDRIDRVYATHELKANPPAVEGMVASADSSHLNCFAATHISFGTVLTSRKAEDDDFSVTVKQDPLGWAGRSPLVASYYVSAAGLALDRETAKIGLHVQERSLIIGLHISLLEQLGEHCLLFETTISDTSHVFITKTMPGMAGPPILCAGSTDALPPVSAHPAMSASLDGTSSEVIALTAHVMDPSAPTDFLSFCRRRLSGPGPIELVQSSPHSIDIVVGNTSSVIPVTFPLPVMKERSHTRISPITGYLELVAPTAESADYDALSDYIWPTILGPDGTPITLNSDRVDLDTLPKLALEETLKGGKKHWLYILAQAQFSAREQELMGQARSSAPEHDQMRNGGGVEKGAMACSRLNSRVNFKASLSSIFQHAAGLHGDQMDQFNLSTPGLGVFMHIFVRALRLDGGVGSVLADAAVLPPAAPSTVLQEVHKFTANRSKHRMGEIECNVDEVRLWNRVLPAMVERCRSWSHTAACEYKKAGASVPLSSAMMDPWLCSCGKGKLPQGYVDLPQAVLRHMVRVAISPVFAVASFEKLID